MRADLPDWLGPEQLRRDLGCWLRDINGLLIGPDRRSLGTVFSALSMIKAGPTALISTHATIHDRAPASVWLAAQSADLTNEIMQARNNDCQQLLIEQLPERAYRHAVDTYNDHVQGLVSVQAHSLLDGLHLLIAKTRDADDPSLAPLQLARAWPIILEVDTDQQAWPRISGCWQAITDDTVHHRQMEMSIRAWQTYPVDRDLDLLPLWQEHAGQLVKVHDPVTPSWWQF